MALEKATSTMVPEKDSRETAPEDTVKAAVKEEAARPAAEAVDTDDVNMTTTSEVTIEKAVNKTATKKAPDKLLDTTAEAAMQAAVVKTVKEDVPREVVTEDPKETAMPEAPREEAAK